MRTLSAIGRPVPRLVERVAALTPEALERLEARNAPELSSYISGKARDLLVLIGRIAGEQAQVPADGRGDTEFRHRILGDTVQLMIALSALGDVLKLAGHALPAGGRPPVQRRLADRIDYFLDRTIHIPVNEIKHRGFDIGWLTLQSEFGVTHGYTVSGRVGSNLSAPIKYRAKDKSSPDGYSFAYVLRNSVLALYGACNALDAALAAAGCYKTATAPDTPRSEPPAAVVKAIESINGLPHRGFFDERGLEVPILELRDGTLVATMRRLRAHPVGTRIHFELNSVAPGMTYKMPYWSEIP